MQESAAGKPQTRECPKCQAVLPVHDGFVTWCDRCGWNMNPSQSEQPKNPFKAAYTKLGHTQSRVLFERYTKAESLRPTLTMSKLLAFVAATIIHSITLVFAALGVALLILKWPNVFAIAGGLLCIGIAWVLHPRIAKMPDGILSRDEFPTLYRLVDTVASSLGASKVHGVVVNEDFNAMYRQVGWRRGGILYLGLPLWVLLDKQEQNALVAHELAHSVNGDAVQGLFVGSALDTLGNWYSLLRPSHRASSPFTITGLATILSRWTLLVLSRVVLLGADLLCHLLWRESQRAEYLADYLAATVSGTAAMLSLMDKLHLGRAYAVTLQRVVLNPRREEDLFEELRCRAARVPPRERERIKRVQQSEGSRLDVTHPPTAYRIKLLEAFYVSEPKVTFSASEFEQIEGELMAIRERIHHKLVDQYRAKLYS